MDMKYKILIVDDEEMITDLISSHLQNCGYNTLIAKNVNEAMEELRHQPNLIILDINMPGTNGLELCCNIRNHISCPIILTDFMLYIGFIEYPRAISILSFLASIFTISPTFKSFTLIL